jgi:signal transduction histidine kinase
LPPGGTIRFYVIAFDAGGHFIKTMQAENQDFAVAVNARNIEEAIMYIVIFGVPLVSIILVASFVMARKHREKKVSMDDLVGMRTKIDNASDENASSLPSRLMRDNT